MAALLVGAGCAKTVIVTNTNNGNANVVVNAVAKYTISYPGQDGKNALELLQSSHQVDVSSAGFVNTIDGQAPVGKQYWAFYINDKLADVGAKAYITKTTDQIGWKLEAY